MWSSTQPTPPEAHIIAETTEVMGPVALSLRIKGLIGLKENHRNIEETIYICKDIEVLSIFIVYIVLNNEC